MNTNDLERFEQFMGVLNEMFGDTLKPITDMKMRVYFQALQDLSIKDLENAAGELARTKTIKTFPLPAEIREATRGKAADRAMIAFDDLIGAIQSGGHYNSIVFEDGCIVKCIESMGGWEAVCNWEAKDREWHRKEFLKLYPVYEARGPWQEAKVIGAHEAHNALHGYTDHIPEPLRIGPKQSAKIEALLSGLKAVGQ